MRTITKATALTAASGLLLTIAGQAMAADLKADLSVTTTGIQQNKDLGAVVGGSTITFTDNLYLQGGPDRLTSATFDDDGNVPPWVSDVTGGIATKTGNAISTITVVAPCAIGAFGADSGSKVAGSSVQYAVTAVNSGAAVGDVATGTAWVNIRGNVTSLGSNCDAGDTVNPTDGSLRIDDDAAWTNSGSGGVTVDLSATDNVGIVKYRLAETQAGLTSAADVSVTPATSFSADNVAFTLTGAEGSAKAVWARVYDAAGRSVDAHDTIGWDKTAPVISEQSASGTEGLNDWYTSNVTVTFSASDSLSGFVGESNPYPFDRTTSGEGSSVTASSGTVDDAAGNTGSSVTSSGYKVDLNNPTVTCGTAPTFILGSSGQLVSGTVSDTAAGSGPASTTATATADTSTIGSKAVDVTGYDNAGRTGSASCGYNVVYDWTGFFRPVDNLPTLNSVKAGSAIPVKFNLGGNQGLNVMEAGFPKSTAIACDSTADVDGVEETVTAGSSSLSYDSVASHYTYVWKTEKSWAGSCRQLVVKLADGTTHRANFKLLK